MNETRIEISALEIALTELMRSYRGTKLRTYRERLQVSITHLAREYKELTGNCFVYRNDRYNHTEEEITR